MRVEWMQLFLAVPIHPPVQELGSEWENVETGDFDFDHPQRFQRLLIDTNEFLYRDDQHQIYYATTVSCPSMDDAKRWRQVQRPNYMKESELPLVNLLDKRQLVPYMGGYDKALAHLVVRVDQVTEAEGASVRFARWANLDGDDDPLVVKANHYLTNRYGANLSYHLAGCGTYSFATVTDNEFYGEQLLKPRVGWLYLLYYTYWIHHGIVPSRQMMPMLLENLWRSTTIQSVYNDALLMIVPIE